MAGNNRKSALNLIMREGPMTASLSAPLTVKGLTIKNRLARSATWEALASPEGLATAKLQNLLAAVAAGGTGLIVTGMASVSRSGCGGPGELLANGSECLPGLTELSAAMKKYGGIAAVQLAHSGAQVDPKTAGVEKPAGPSALDMPGKPPVSCRELSLPEIQTIVDDFAAAAALCARAGFDAVQLHCAHGYLLSQFLSPFYNRRADRYGGSILNRGRLILEILEAIRGKAPDSLVLSAKINSQDYVDGGLAIEDSRAIAGEMAAQGLDMIEVSGGLPQAGKLGPIRPKPETPADEAPFAPAAAWFKEKLKIPVYVVAAVRSRGVAEHLVSSGQADGVALSRPLIREPDLAAKWLDGRQEGADCVSCNACFKIALREPNGLYCPLVNPAGSPY